MLLPLGLILLAIVIAWIFSDWQIRTARAACLMLAAAGVDVAISTQVVSPWGVLVGAIVGGLLALPILLHHPSLTVLPQRDTEMVQRLGKIEGMLVSAGGLYRSRRVGGEEYRTLILSARDRLDAIQAPDAEWASVIRAVRRDIDSALSASPSSDPNKRREDVARHRAFVRNAYRDLIRRRSRRWSWTVAR